MKHVSTLSLHRLRYGELDASEEQALRDHLHSCEACAARLRAQENHRAAFELEPVPQALRTRGSRQRWGRWLVAPALAVAAVLLAVPLLTSQPDVTLKGGSADLEAWIHQPDGARQLHDSDRVFPGDRIQLRYRNASYDLVTFAGMDASGEVEVYGTYEANEGGGWHTAPIALTLDETPGAQVFFGVYSDEVPSEAELVRALRRGEELRDAEIVVVSFNKAR